MPVVIYAELEVVQVISKRPESGESPMDIENWVTRYGDYLYRFALSRVHQTSLAEDLVQETFLAALAGKENFKTDL
jgi:RNA polymerase sigma-70 factor (ECF subfamily)